MDYTPEQWQLILKNATAALHANPQDQEAMAAITDANKALGAAETAGVPQAPTDQPFDTEQALTGIGQGLLDIPRGVGSAVAHPLDALGELTGISHWGDVKNTFSDPNAMIGEKLDALARAIPGVNIGYSAERGLLDATGAKAEDTGASQEDQWRAGTHVASLPLIGAGGGVKTTVPGLGALDVPITAVADAAKLPFKSVAAIVKYPIAKTQEATALAELAKARTSRTQTLTKTAETEAPLKARIGTARASAAEEGLAQRLAERPIKERTLRAKATVAEAGEARQPAIMNRLIAALGREPEVGENLTLRNELLKKRLAGGSEESGGGFPQLEPVEGAAPAETPIAASPMATPLQTLLQQLVEAQYKFRKQVKKEL